MWTYFVRWPCIPGRMLGMLKKRHRGESIRFSNRFTLKKLMGITKGNTLSENQPARKKRKTIQVGRVVSFPCMCCHICRVLARVSHQWDILTIPTTTLSQRKKSHIEKGTPTHTHTHTSLSNSQRLLIYIYSCCSPSCVVKVAHAFFLQIRAQIEWMKEWMNEWVNGLLPTKHVASDMHHPKQAWSDLIWYQHKTLKYGFVVVVVVVASCIVDKEGRR